MKFNHSERAFHQQNQFVPPCNIYSSLAEESNNKSPLTGSLKGPSLPNRNTFGYSQRFDNKSEKIMESIPGPGSYQNIQLSNSKGSKRWDYGQSSKKLAKGVNLLLSSSENSAPSIPFSYYGQKVDQQEEKYIKQLRMKEDPMRSEKITMKNATTYSFSKSDRNSLLNPKNRNFIPKGKLPFIEQEEQYNKTLRPENKQREKMKKTELIWKQKLQKSNQRRRQIINLINPEFVPSLELIDLLAKKKTKYNPGPGFYEKDIPENSSERHIKGPVTFSDLKRFSVDKESILGPGLYHSEVDGIKKNNGFSFNRFQRQNLFDEQTRNIDDNFRFYIQTDNRSKSQINLQTTSPAFSSPFGTGTTRFTSVNPKQTDGGSTTASRISNISQQQNLSNGNAVYRDVEMEKTKSQRKFMKKIRTRLSKQTQYEEKDQGLLGISTMVSAIQ